jgi:hypothetical protein
MEKTIMQAIMFTSGDTGLYLEASHSVQIEVG